MRKSLWAIIAAQVLMYGVVILDIPIVRQITMWVYLTIIPGILVLKVLRLHETGFVDTILFSVGLSIAFLMFVGLSMNELLPLLGISRPLSTFPLMITISVLTSALFFVSYKQDLARVKNANPVNIRLRAIPSQAPFLVFLPLLSVIGALYVNILILLLMIIVIAALYALSVSSSRLVPSKLYPFMILAISIALLFHTSLISKYLMGYDVPLEYYVFRLTEIDGFWQPAGTYATAFKSLLSITILPTIYSILLNIKGELIFKIIYPLIFSLEPLVLYQIYKGQTGKLVALLSVFFFMSSYNAFYGVEALSLTRQIIGELFFVLLMLLLVNKKIAPRKRQVLFMIFGAALVVSHYSLAYICLLYIILTFIVSFKTGARKMLNGTSVLLFTALLFSWQIFVSDSPLKYLMNVIQTMYYHFAIDLFDPNARIADWQTSIISPYFSGTLNLLDKVLFYIRHFFIIAGTAKLAFLMVRQKKTKFYAEYSFMSILSVFIIFLCVAVPHFAPAINLTRFYHITLLFLAPFFPLGGEAVFSLGGKVRTLFPHKSRNNSHRNLELWLVSIVLIASFLFEVGFVYHVAGEAHAGMRICSLDMIRIKTMDDLRLKISFYGAYAPEQDIFSAIWLSKNIDETSRIYADRVSGDHVLTSYGLISKERVYLLSNSTVLEHGTYIYLRHLNVVDGVIGTYGKTFNISEVTSLLNESNKIYSNRDSDIYQSLPSD